MHSFSSFQKFAMLAIVEMLVSFVHEDILMVFVFLAK